MPQLSISSQTSAPRRWSSRGWGSLSDDDIRVFLRAAGVESSRRMLGVSHSVLMGLDGHYRARIQARDAFLQQHHPGASMTTPSPSPSPAPGLGPTSKQATKGAGLRHARRSQDRLLPAPRLPPRRHGRRLLRQARVEALLEQPRAKRLRRQCQGRRRPLSPQCPLRRLVR